MRYRSWGHLRRPRDNKGGIRPISALSIRQWDYYRIFVSDPICSPHDHETIFVFNVQFKFNTFFALPKHRNHGFHDLFKQLSASCFTSASKRPRGRESLTITLARKLVENWNCLSIAHRSQTALQSSSHGLAIEPFAFCRARLTAA